MQLYESLSLYLIDYIVSYLCDVDAITKKKKARQKLNFASS